MVKYLINKAGLSPSINSLSQIENIERFSEPPTSGSFCDLLRSDPDEIEGNF
jgi:serine/threonine-protein phosphatase 2B catalytic subunit